jgi:SAM-dependent methyltransferase
VGHDISLKNKKHDRRVRAFEMTNWITIVLLLAGGLFLVKMIYVLSIAMVLPSTGGALFVTTSQRRISAFLDVVPMRAGMEFVDLGCGDGRVLRSVCKRYAVKAIGYELNPLAFILARLFCFGYKDVDVRLGNFLKADLAQADVIFCYLYPDVMQDISHKIVRYLKPGAILVSCNFQLPGHSPSKVVRPPGSLHNDPIFIYKVIER